MQYSAQSNYITNQPTNMYHQQSYPNYSHQHQTNQSYQQQPTIMQQTPHLQTQPSAMMRPLQQQNQIQQTQYNQQSHNGANPQSQVKNVNAYAQPSSSVTAAVAHPPTLLKQVDRASKVAWCPSSLYSNLIASGEFTPNKCRF